MPTYRNRTPGRCIYCLSPEKLGREHIVPESLGGRLILPGASCRQCEAVTSDIERVVARDIYGQHRTRTKLKVKKKKRKPPRPVSVIIGPDEAQMAATIAEPGAIVFAPIFQPTPIGILENPPVLTGRGVGWVFTMKRQEPIEPDLWKTLPAGPIRFSSGPIHLETYARVLAKIAHAFAAAIFGLDRFEAWLPPIIRGEDVEFGKLIGASPLPLHGGQVVHALKWAAFPHADEYLLAVDIVLFPYLEQPWIRVIVGRTTVAAATAAYSEELAGTCLISP